MVYYGFQPIKNDHPQHFLMLGEHSPAECQDYMENRLLGSPEVVAK